MTEHKGLAGWVEEVRNLCQPERIHWCDGTEDEFKALCDLMSSNGTRTQVNEMKRPNSFLARAHPTDVARVVDRTFICSANKEDAGPTNHWADPREMKAKLKALFSDCMRGRTMYVVPFAMGPF